jgi:hypothetical protein
MAEIVGLISGIGTIVVAAFKISRAIAQAYDDFGAATATVKAIAHDAEFLATTLGLIQDRISGDRAVRAEMVKRLGHLVERCKADMDEMERSLLPFFSRVKSGEPLSQRQKLHWLFAKSRICTQQATLKSLNTHLQTFVCLMQWLDGCEAK